MNISPTYFFTLDDTICQGGFVILPGGDTATVAGTYTDSLLTGLGCDSIYVTNLTVNPTFDLTQNPSICQGDSFLLPGGVFVGVAGTYTDSLSTAQGCDSVITTNLTVDSIYNLAQSIDLCDGDTLVLPGGSVVDSAGVFTDTLQTNAGCDSVIVTTVSILPTYQNGQTVTICDGDFVVLPGGDTVTVAGTYTDSLQTGAGCDSIVTTTLVVDPTFATAVSDSICDGDSYTLPGGAVVTVGGVYLDTLTAANTCDSVITTTLTVNPVFNLAVNADICQGDSFALPGGSFVNTAGVYTDSLTTTAGCDSVIVTTLTVNPTYLQFESGILCTGDSLTLPGGGVVFTAGTYTDSLVSTLGCDSVIVTVVTVNPTFAFSVSDTICQGDSYLLPGGGTVTTAGTYNDTLSTVDGCDSVITTVLTVNPSYNIPVTADICQGDSFTLPGGGVVSTSGTYTDTLQTGLGCDSIIVTTLTVNLVYNQSVSASICDGDDYQLPGGGVVNSAGIYTDSLTSSLGCDSVIVTTLTLDSTYNQPVTASICSNEDYTLPGGGVVTSAGVYNDTLSTSSGCDSVIVTTLTVETAYSDVVADSICDGDSYTLPGGGIVTTTGIYIDSLTAANGCDSIIETDLTVISIDTGLTQTNITLTSEQNNATYQWYDCAVGGGPIPGATSQSYTPLVNGDYSVIITFAGCTDTSACTQVIVIGVAESDFSDQLSVYPNPGSGQFWLDLGQQYLEVDVWVTDARGRRVFQQRREGVQEMVLDLNDLSDGMYFVQVRADGYSGAVKVLVKR